jgi:phosphoglucosamine mutase
MAVAALDLIARDGLKEKTLVATVMSNAGLDAALEAAGGRVVRTDVGDKNVIDEMLRQGFNLGGEQSGHMIFRDFSTTGDGLVAALLLCGALDGRTLAEAAAVMRRHPQVKENVRIRSKTLPQGLLDEVARHNEELAGRGRVLVRPSGTEPVVRLLAEARTEAEARELSATIAALVRRELG